MNARFMLPGTGRFTSADTIVPDPMNPQSFNRFAYVLGNPITHIDPTGHYECAADIDCEWMPPTDDYSANRAYEGALWFYSHNFVLPFDGNPSYVRGIGPNHNGVDWAGDINVIAPYEGVVTRAGKDQPAGMWRIQNSTTGEIREWSVLSTATHGRLYERNRLESGDGLLEPERLLASGEWIDLRPEWSHVQGTVIKVEHSHHLTTIYYHTVPAVTTGNTLNQGDPLGETANTGFSTGTHLHQTVLFSYDGKVRVLNPLTAAHG